MSWLTVIWSMLASACLTFALLHLFTMAKGIKPWANLSFAAAALSVAVITGMELMAMRTTSAEQFAAILRWVQLPIFILWIAILCFVRCYFDAGRSWLAWTGFGLRALALILSFTTGQNLFFKEITGLKRITVWDGETISIAQGMLNPGYLVGPLSTLMLVAFVLDAAFTLWHRETGSGRRRAVVFSGGIIFFLLAAVVHSLLVHLGVVNSPYIIGFSFMPILMAMSYELSYDMFHSVQIANQLRASEAELRLSKQRMKLAASAADLRLWEWDIVRDEIWGTGTTHSLYGIPESQKISYGSFLNILYEEDRARVMRALEKSMSGNGDFESEYRIRMPDGRLHWFNSRGRIDFNSQNEPLRMLGVTMDITRRKEAELEVQQQRTRLSHLSRVTLLGELSGSLAHELNQPLTAILSNSQAAKRFLEKDPVDLAEVRHILDDIITENKRAGDIIQRLRQMMKKSCVQHLPLDLSLLVQDVLKLLNSDLVNHHISVNVDFDQKLPAVIGDRVQIQQVLLNLIMNACESMSHTQENQRRIFIRTERISNDKVQVAVIDQGSGISSDNVENVFEPFFTTKANGMGLGLTICRSMISAHGGQLRITHNHPRGTGFYFTLPIYQGEST